MKPASAFPRFECETRDRSPAPLPLIYFCAGALIGTWGTLLTTLTLPSEAMLLSVSRTRKNFSASIARLLIEVEPLKLKSLTLDPRNAYFDLGHSGPDSHGPVVPGGPVCSKTQTGP